MLWWSTKPTQPTSTTTKQPSCDCDDNHYCDICDRYSSDDDDQYDNHTEQQCSRQVDSPIIKHTTHPSIQPIQHNINNTTANELNDSNNDKHTMVSAAHIIEKLQLQIDQQAQHITQLTRQHQHTLTTMELQYKQLLSHKQSLIKKNETMISDLKNDIHIQQQQLQNKSIQQYSEQISNLNDTIVQQQKQLQLQQIQVDTYNQQLHKLSDANKNLQEYVHELECNNNELQTRLDSITHTLSNAVEI